MIFVVIIVVMVITGTLLAVFLSPRNVTFTCSQVLLANWTNIRPVDEEDDETAGDDIKMTLQVNTYATQFTLCSVVIVRFMQWLRIIITFQSKSRIPIYQLVPEIM